MSKQGRAPPKSAPPPVPGTSGGPVDPVWNDPLFLPIAVAVLVVILTICMFTRRMNLYNEGY